MARDRIEFCGRYAECKTGTHAPSLLTRYGHYGLQKSESKLEESIEDYMPSEWVNQTVTTNAEPRPGRRLQSRDEKNTRQRRDGHEEGQGGQFVRL
jgi:hypothetical protein